MGWSSYHKETFPATIWRWHSKDKNDILHTKQTRNTDFLQFKMIAWKDSEPLFLVGTNIHQAVCVSWHNMHLEWLCSEAAKAGNYLSHTCVKTGCHLISMQRLQKLSTERGSCPTSHHTLNKLWKEQSSRSNNLKPGTAATHLWLSNFGPNDLLLACVGEIRNGTTSNTDSGKGWLQASGC